MSSLNNLLYRFPSVLILRLVRNQTKVIKLFKKYGFTQAQISRLLRTNVQLLVADTEKSNFPKLEFFYAKGVSWPRFAKILCQFPTVLSGSLDKNIMPSFKYLSNFLHSDEKAVTAFQRYPDILIANVDKCLSPNIDILREHGVPESNIIKLIQSHPQALVARWDILRKIVEEALEMGFNPKMLMFDHALLALRRLSKSAWESKVDAYKKWGCSEEDVFNAFRTSPFCKMYSKDKIMASMDFFFNQMGWLPCLIAKCPLIIGLSLKKRAVPRCSVFQVFSSEGLVEKDVSIWPLLMVPEEKFLQKFVMPYKEEASELLIFQRDHWLIRHEKPVASSER